MYWLPCVLFSAWTLLYTVLLCRNNEATLCGKDGGHRNAMLADLIGLGGVVAGAGIAFATSSAPTTGIVLSVVAVGFIASFAANWGLLSFISKSFVYGFYAAGKKGS